MKKKTILLYFPKLEPKLGVPRSPPLALLAIAAPLLKEGYDVKIFDALVDADAKDKVLENLDNAICLGISVWTGYPITDSLELARRVKSANPDFPIIWGGWHPSLFPSQTVENPNIDIVVRGQGELTFLELVKCLEKNGSLKGVLGITYKSKGKIITNPDRPRTPLDDLPSYAYNLIDIEKYMTNGLEGLGKRAVGYISSQGCPFNCNFCADSKLYNRKRMEFSVERVLKDFKYLIETYNITGFAFEDTNFFVNKKRVLKICQGIVDNKWNIGWIAYERVNHFLTFSEEEIALIKKSGCIHLKVGAESGSQRTLDFLNKKIKAEDITRLSKLYKKYDLAVRFSFMVGIPRETSEDLKQTLDLIKKVYKDNKKNEVMIFFFTPYPGTPLYNLIIKKYGFKEPKSLTEWSQFDWTRIETKWVDKNYKEKINTFLFYLRLAYTNVDFNKKINKPYFKIPYFLMHKFALFRLNHDFLKFPVERKTFNLLKSFWDI